MNICVYAAYYDNDIRKMSSSGGVFSLIASKFDVVYGVAMTDDCYGAIFIRAEKDISALRGSKYLQARMGDTFIHVRNDLKSGKKVLFTGTSCQVNGLKKFLNLDYDNLLCVDVICHGVPSPALWEMYIKYCEELYGKKIESVDFRCKDFGWKNYAIRMDAMRTPQKDDAYMRMFLRDYCLRPSCYECRTKENKISDMTIADFWGIENVAPDMDDGMGTSLVIIRTEKGSKIFQDISNSLKYREVSYEDGVKQNPAEYLSVKRPSQRDTFFEDMQSMCFGELSNKYAVLKKISFWRRLKQRIKAILKGAGKDK